MTLGHRIGNYLLSVPERLVRSATGISAGLLHELSGVAIPAAVRRTRLYQNLVENTLRFLIEQVAEVDGAYPESAKLADDFAVRRAAGNGIEMVGLIAFRASPVWVMAALADLSGAGRHLIREIAAELKSHQLLDPRREFTTMDELLAGLETFSEHTANTINTPPLDTRALRREWNVLRANAAALPTPAVDSIEALSSDLRNEAQHQGRSVFALSSMMALYRHGRAPRATRLAVQVRPAGGPPHGRAPRRIAAWPLSLDARRNSPYRIPPILGPRVPPLPPRRRRTIFAAPPHAHPAPY